MEQLRRKSQVGLYFCVSSPALLRDLPKPATGDSWMFKANANNWGCSSLPGMTFEEEIEVCFCIYHNIYHAYTMVHAPAIYHDIYIVYRTKKL